MIGLALVSSAALLLGLAANGPHASALAYPLANPFPGRLVPTGRPLDLAVRGEGFLMIERPDGTVGLTRSVRLAIGPAGELVDEAGRSLLPPVVVPPRAEDLRIEPTGIVRCRLPRRIEPLELGRIDLAAVADPRQLRRGSDGLLAPSEETGPLWTARPGEQGLGWVETGVLESPREARAPLHPAVFRSGYPLDLRVDGPGWFLKSDASCLRLTRFGRLVIGTDRVLRFEDGAALVPEIALPQTLRRLHVRPDGQVIAEIDNGDTLEVGRILLVRPFDVPDLPVTGWDRVLVGLAPSWELDVPGSWGLGLVRQFELDTHRPVRSTANATARATEARRRPASSPARPLSPARPPEKKR